VRLRERQKIEREAAIVEAAATLFAQHGYHATSMEMIAEIAGLAVGTIYNYFDSKALLLKAIVLRDREASLAANEPYVLRPPDDPADAIRALVIAQMQGAMRLDRRLWRVVQATTSAEPTTFGLDYKRSADRLTDQIARLLRVLRERGSIAPDVDVEITARMIKYLGSEMFRRFVAEESRTLDDVDRDLRPMIAMLCRGLEPLAYSRAAASD